MSKTKDLTERVVEALEVTPLNTVTLSTGVVLKIKQVPPLAFIKVMAAFPRPKPPVVFIKAMGREMENPDDPAYLERLKAHNSESSDAIMNALILLGTTLVSVPKGFSTPDSNDWIEAYRALGLTPLPDNKSWRYVNWISFVAATDAQDLILIRDQVGRLSGIPEEAVQSAESFPGSGKNGTV